MDSVQKSLFLGIVRKTLSEDPTFLRDVIDAATCGVKDFADKQSDGTSKMAFKLFSILESTDKDVLKFGPFSEEDILSEIERWFEGTQGLKKLREKFEIACKG